MATSTASTGDSTAACRTAFVTSSETIRSSPCATSSETGTPWRASRSRTACLACGTDASTAGAVYC
ncbi:hypothetical protein SGLAM104S_06431 [Streptomyces glaucescens]